MQSYLKKASQQQKHWYLTLDAMEIYIINKAELTSPNPKRLKTSTPIKMNIEAKRCLFLETENVALQINELSLVDNDDDIIDDTGDMNFFSLEYTCIRKNLKKWLDVYKCTLMMRTLKNLLKCFLQF